MALDSMHDLLLEQLRDLYSAENQLVKALPKLIDKITNPTLREAVSAHYGETQGHVTRLDRIFNGLAEKASGEKCKGMEGLIDECDHVAGEHGSDYVRDAGIIASAQRAEHYEIAAYGSTISFARLLGHQDIVTLLEETLAEEKAADEKLTGIAEEEVNQQAMTAVAGAAHGKY